MGARANTIRAKLREHYREVDSRGVGGAKSFSVACPLKLLGAGVPRVSTLHAP